MNTTRIRYAASRRRRTSTTLPYEYRKILVDLGQLTDEAAAALRRFTEDWMASWREMADRIYEFGRALTAASTTFVSPDEARGASVDDLIPDIDDVLDGWKANR